MRRVVLAGLVTSIFGLGHAATAATIASSPNDPFQGSTVDSFSSAYNANESPTKLFDSGTGTNGSGNIENLGTFIFAEGGPATEFVNFTAPNSVNIAGVNLFNYADSNDDTGTRGISAFRLYQLAAKNSTVGEILLVNASNSTGATDPKPSNGAGGGNGPSDHNGSPNVYTFATPVTGQFFRLEIDRTSNGPRIAELDAVAAPEPTSLGIIGLGALALVAHRRRRYVV